MNDSLLIQNAAAILTGRAGVDARHPGPDLRIRGSRIEAIGRLTPAPGERRLDASDCVVYPAWVNTHHHLAESLLKGIPAGIDLNLSDWVRAVPIAYRGCYDERSARIAARIGMVELVLSGCGTIADHNFLYFPDAGFDSSAIFFEEAQRFGIRFVLCRGGATSARRDVAGPRDRWRPESFSGFLDGVEQAARAWHDPGEESFRRVVMAPTTPVFDMSADEFRECARAGRALGLRLHTHLAETVNYHQVTHERHGCTPVEFAERHEWVGPDVWFAHLVKLSAGDIRILGDTRTGIAHCPQSNGRLGSGIAPVRDLEASGARVSIGVDGAGSNEAADMISEVHAAWLMQRARAGEAALPRFRGGDAEGGAAAASVEDVVRWGTAGGAEVLGFKDLGTLAPGRLADIAVYRLDHPRYLGLHDLGTGPVISGGEPFLRALLVGGRIIAENGAIPGLDLPRLRADARAAQRAVVG